MSSPIFPSPTATQTLQLELSLLQVLHHRNKNQHHLQPFFKHLSILKRTLGLLLDHPDSDFLLQKLRALVIPQAWESFSRVVARGEFVALGMVLVAVVGRIAYCLGGVELGEEIEVEYTGLREENEELGVPVRRHVMDEEIMVGDLEGYGDGNVGTEPIPSPPQDMDVPEMGNVQNDANVPMKAAADEALGEIQQPRKKRRRKRQMDDIDILFAGL
jgi:hypothetical protein